MLTEKVNELFSSQLSEWDLAKINYELLSKVRIRHIDFGGFEILVQFNPERIRSSAAKVDSKSIEARPCFLCRLNRPVQQRDLAFNDKYTLLVNPFPIFRRHLTITFNEHTDQRIIGAFDDLLSLAEALPGFVAFYNGPQCGASAPDHLHFQAGNRGQIPVENDFLTGRHAIRVAVKSGAEIWLWEDYLRSIITMKGSDRQQLSLIFNNIMLRLSAFQPEKPEPLVNILVYYNPDGWIIHVIPRKIHRPSQFFAEGELQILLSPASVDLGGLIITPREEDFMKITKDDLADIFSQVCYDRKELSDLAYEII